MKPTCTCSNGLLIIPMETSWSLVSFQSTYSSFISLGIEGNSPSAFLRVLEYYEGILFLTSNRADTIDPAFRSRIHLSIAYPPLSADARRSMWRSCIARANRNQPPDWLTEKLLDGFAARDMNGREIKTTTRIGYMIARNARRDLQPTDLLHGTQALEELNRNFGEALEEDRRRFSRLMRPS